MYIKTSFLVRMTTLCGVAWMAGGLALAQTAPAAGVLVPVTANMPAPEHPHHDHKNHDHEDHEHHHKKGDKGPLLPASDQFKSLNTAISHCPSGTVEWATLDGSAFYHGQSSRYFGHTKHGAYACKAALNAAGFRAGR